MKFLQPELIASRKKGGLNKIARENYYPQPNRIRL
jgi:hypothetical protein